MEDNKYNRIAAYLNGQLPEEERIDFEKEYASSADFKKEVDSCRTLWEQTELLKKQSQFNVSGNWYQLQRRIHRTSTLLRAWNGIRTTAAILMIPLGLTLTYLLTQKENRTLPQTEEMIKVTSAPGLVSQITLPDSTVVWLNSGTSLTYPRRFVSDGRKVILAGEAFFKVKADPEHRFDVTVPGQITVSAYGTEFNVSAYSDDSTIEAVLAKGHIEVNTPGTSPRKLHVAQQATVNKTTGHVNIDHCDLNEKLGWKEGKLIFKRAGLEDIIKKLSRHFNADFIVEGHHRDAYELSATFTNESLPEILSILQKTAPMKYYIEETHKQDDHTYSRKRIRLVLAK